MSETIFQNSGCVNTILGSFNHLNAFLPLKYKQNIGTTLNHKYSVLASYPLTEQPNLLYFGIGVNGYSCASSNNGRSLHIKHQPDCRNMDLYEPIPFRIVPVSNDLTPAQRAKYRMRVVRTIEGVEYAHYYLKLIEWDPDYAEIVVYKTDGQVEQYSLNNGFLTPTVPSASTTGGAIDQTDRIIVRAIGICNVSVGELSDYMSLYEHKNYCEISEFGFYTGVDKVLNSDGEVAENEMTDTEENPENVIKEATYVQLAKHKTQLPVTLDSDNSSLETKISIEESNSVSI